MTEQEDLPQSLADVLNSNEFDDEAGVVIESAKFTGDYLYLGFTIRFSQDTPQQFWKLMVTGVKEEHISSDWSQDINLYTQHILLLEHTEPQSELYFTGTTTQSQALFIDIFQSLVTFAGNKEDIFKYIYLPDDITQLSQQGYGLFARGPKTILNIYQQCLMRQGIKAYYIREYLPSASDSKLKLFKLGESWIIGQDFIFERVE